MSFSRKNLLGNAKVFPSPCLKPMDLKVPLKLMENNMNYYLPHIILMKSSDRCIIIVFINMKISCFGTLLKWHFGMGLLLCICCIFSECLDLKIPPEACFCQLCSGTQKYDNVKLVDRFLQIKDWIVRKNPIFLYTFKRTRNQR